MSCHKIEKIKNEKDEELAALSGWEMSFTPTKTIFILLKTFLAIHDASLIAGFVE